MQPSVSQDFAADTVQRMFRGETLAEIFGVPKQELEASYTKGCELLGQGDFDGALDMLLVVVTQNPYEVRYQFAFGLCLHQLGRVVDAAQHYALAWTLDPSDAGCALRLGECHAALGDREAAAEAFHTAIELCSPPDTNPDIRLAAEAALDQLNA